MTPRPKFSNAVMFVKEYVFELFVRDGQIVWVRKADEGHFQIEILDGKCFLLDDPGLAALDFLARDLMPVVPDLVNQLANDICSTESTNRGSSKGARK
jgi:hypothetical protein